MSQGMFYLWWLLVNGFMYFAEFQFLLRFPRTEKSRPVGWLCIVYISANSVLTLLALLFSFPVLLRELLHIAILFLLAVYCLERRWTETLTLAVILLSISTFTEGLFAVLMRWLQTSLTRPWLGNILQVSLSVILSILFFLSLRFIAKRYGFTGRQVISPYLYVLLLPCVFVVWIVRFGFGLNSTELSELHPPFGSISLLWGLLVILGAAAVFAVILVVFDKILTLTQQEKESALLNAQLKEQEVYIAEAQKREKQYRSFQHDIDNHLMVLSGLIQDEKYNEAKQYFSQLHTVSSELVRSVITGNPALDVLLGEKINYARQNNITVLCNASLPPRLSVRSIDVCIILANALDNAIKACQQDSQIKPDITITIQPRHQFLLLEVTNSISSTVPILYGTGLTNIRRTADKYQGSMELEQVRGRVRLSVLLCLEAGEISPNTK